MYDKTESTTKLVRGLGLPQAVALNIANMVGIEPFITIPGLVWTRTLREVVS